MKLLLIGTGAVGCAVAIAAANAGMETTLLARSGAADELRAHGLKRTGIFGELAVAPERLTVCEDYDSVAPGQDYVAVAVKTMANAAVAAELAAHRDILGETGRIVIFQNGWGNDDAYLAHFPASQVFNARVITGFARSAPGVTNVTVHTAPCSTASSCRTPSPTAPPPCRTSRTAAGRRSTRSTAASSGSGSGTPSRRRRTT